MALFAISDLHLSLDEDKPMDVFGENWSNHDEKIKKSWSEIIKEEDTVLIAGDISWSMRMGGAIKELQWIHELPGKKIFIRGNHDYWWSSIKKLNNLYDDMCFIQNNYFTYKDYAICGTRGWTIPSESSTAHDKKIFGREIIRLKLSLDNAIKDGYKNIIVMLHYPPVNESFQENEIIKILKEYNIKIVIYGHLHGPSLNNVFEGEKDGIKYILTSCDYLNFKPLKILE